MTTGPEAADGRDHDAYPPRRPQPLYVTLPADPDQLGPVRAALRRWLEQLNAPPHLAQNVLVAAGEACANAIEHGHRPGRQVWLSAHVTAGELHLIVADSGRWRPPELGDDARRGRGLALIMALMDRVTIDPGDAGTTVIMSTRIGDDHPSHPVHPPRPRRGPHPDRGR